MARISARTKTSIRLKITISQGLDPEPPSLSPSFSLGSIYCDLSAIYLFTSLGEDGGFFWQVALVPSLQHLYGPELIRSRSCNPSRNCTVHLFMADSDDERRKLVVNQPYDESLEVNDEEEVASTFSPSPRPTLGKTSGSKNPAVGSISMTDQSDDEFDHDNLVEAKEIVFYYVGKEKKEDNKYKININFKQKTQGTSTDITDIIKIKQYCTRV